MATVTTSLGVGTSHDENAAISAVSGAGPWTVTIAANSSVNGDALHDEHASPRKYLITAGGGTTSLTVRDSEGVGGEPDNSGTSLSAIKRYYSTMPLWEADLDDTGLYASGDIAVAECYADADFTAVLTINGGGTVGILSTEVTAPVGERHDGTRGTGVTVDSSGVGAIINSTVTNRASLLSWITGLDWGAGSSGKTGVRIGSNGVLDEVHHMLLDGGSSPHTTCVRGIDCQRNTVNCHNNFLLNVAGASGGGYGIRLGNSAINVQNNTIYNQDAIGINCDNGSTTVCQNNIAFSDGVDYDEAGANFATEDHNLSGDATAEGTGSLISGVAADIFVSTTGGSEDLHLKSGAAVDPIDAGVDLGTTPTGVQFDIDNRDRDAEGDTWDMGAHEFVAAGAPDTEAATRFTGELPSRRTPLPNLAGMTPSCHQGDEEILVKAA